MRDIILDEFIKINLFDVIISDRPDRRDLNRQDQSQVLLGISR